MAERGQVGIGTLIVFIAMVLVATIASGVLIDTAGFLQSKSEQTGQEAVDRVGSRLQVTSKVGRVPDMGNQNYVVIDETVVNTHRSLEDYDARIRIPTGEKVRVSTSTTQHLIIGGNASPNIDPDNAVIYRVSQVNGNQIQFKDLTNNVVVNTVTPPVTIETSADDDVSMTYPSDEILDYTDELYFGSTAWDAETATADFLGASKLWTANLTVTAGPGSDPIDLTDATIVYQSDNQQRYLSYAGNGRANETAFAVTTLTGDGDDVIERGEQAKITIDVDAVEDLRHGLPLGEEAKVTIITGATQITVTLNPPSTTSGQPYVSL